MSGNEQKVYDLLACLGVPFERYEHPPVYTSEQALAYDAGLDAANAKNLFLTNTERSRFYLVIIQVAKKLKIRELAQHLGEKKLTFASPEELLRLLGLTPGSVSPFGLINDKAGEVHVILDKEIAVSERVNFHPNVNTASIIIASDGFSAVLRHFPNKVVMLDL